MLTQSDVDITRIRGRLDQLNLGAVFLVPTKTGIEKSIMDATLPVRRYLDSVGCHNYARQEQGQEHKGRVKSFLVYADRLEPTIATLYRPSSGNGDPRIWFKGLNNHVAAGNLLAILYLDNALYVINCSDPTVLDSADKVGSPLGEIVARVRSTEDPIRVTVPEYPEKLLDWAGHRSGGVRKAFHHEEGRPSGGLIRTRLLDRLDSWAIDLVEAKVDTPRIIFLIGGPGNGKTEAIEACIRAIDDKGAFQGAVIREFEDQFSVGTGRPVPRLATVRADAKFGGQEGFELAIVQDASVGDVAFPEKSPPELLLSDLENYALSSSGSVYLACVNRGVLDDAYSEATDSNRDDARELLTHIIRAVGLSSDAPSCWPLTDYPSIAIWPMDVESLLIGVGDEGVSPAEHLLKIAINPDDWPEFGGCPAGEFCPYCTSRKWLDDERRRTGLLKLLRWYELSSGKRWSFRDLGSLFSFLLAGVHTSEDQQIHSPCENAAGLLELDTKNEQNPTPKTSQAFFLLVSSLYEHALFGTWPRLHDRSFRKDLKNLKLDKEPTLIGLYHFLNNKRRRSLPSTLEGQLERACELLDPAIADPDEEVQVSGRTSLKFRELDVRFSQSVSEGSSFIQRFKTLAPLEIEILKRLSKVDKDLSDPKFRSRSPASATRVQMVVREFANRLVRRSLGVQDGVTRDVSILRGFERVMGGDDTLMHQVVKQVEKLLNDGDHFVTSLNTTFGEPSLPRARATILSTPKQRVVPPQSQATEGRPAAAVRFLLIGNSRTRQSVPLTFELFKSVSELDQGLLPAVLPRTVIALLDTTRARLSGQIVRDEELLEGAAIRVGSRKETIFREIGKFIVEREEAE
jgi:hypothetical protein